MARQISQTFSANYVNSGPKALGKPWCTIIFAEGLQAIVRYSTEKVRDFCHAIKLS